MSLESNVYLALFGETHEPMIAFGTAWSTNKILIMYSLDNSGNSLKTAKHVAG